MRMSTGSRPPLSAQLRYQSSDRVADSVVDGMASVPGYPIVQHVFPVKPEEMDKTTRSVINIKTNKLQRSSTHEHLSVPSLL